MFRYFLFYWFWFSGSSVCLGIFCFCFLCFFLVGLFFICLSVISPGFIHLFPFILLFYICVLVFNFLSWALFIYLFIYFFFCFVFPLCTSSKALGPRLGVEPRPLWWECQVQASGQPKDFRPQVILINMSFPHWSLSWHQALTPPNCLQDPVLYGSGQAPNKTETQFPLSMKVR